MIFRGKLYFCGRIETIIQPTHADSADTQPRKANFIAPLISTSVFNCADSTAQEWSNDQWAF